MMIDVEQLIGGVWRPGTSDYGLTVHNPADCGEVTTVSIASEADVTAAVKAARDAAPAWSRTPAAARAAALHAAAGAVEAAADDLAATMSAEMGKPVDGARNSIAAGIATLRQYAELGPVHRGRTLAGDDAMGGIAGAAAFTSNSWATSRTPCPGRGM